MLRLGVPSAEPKAPRGGIHRFVGILQETLWPHLVHRILVVMIYLFIVTQSIRIPQQQRPFGNEVPVVPVIFVCTARETHGLIMQSHLVGLEVRKQEYTDHDRVIPHYLLDESTNIRKVFSVLWSERMVRSENFIKFGLGFGLSAGEVCHRKDESKDCGVRGVDSGCTIRFPETE